jgi:hypothetical protein
MTGQLVAADSPRTASGREGRHSTPNGGRNRRQAFRRPERTIKTARANQNSLGGRHLAIGMMLTGAVAAIFLFWRFAIQWVLYPTPVLSFLAWVLFVAMVVGTIVVLQRRTPPVPAWLFPAVLAISAAVVALDLVGCWGRSDTGTYPTAAPAVGSLFAAFIMVRRTREILVVTAVLGLVMLAYAISEERNTLLTVAPEMLIIGLGVIPPILGVAIVRAFRRMVQLELDLVLVQSTVSQPRFAVGMLASEELARLDLDAEQLLDDVAEQRIPLPLDLVLADTASSLATELRLHLIKGRKETWLHHAITESEFLAPSVRLSDPSGLAGLLSPVQRDALLLTLWLLVGDAKRTAATVSLTLGPISPTHGLTSRRKVRFPIEMTTTGVPRRKVDPETWQAIRVVGPHTDSIRDGSLRVDIECSVDNPADA